MSTTTEENAAFVNIMLKRSTFAGTQKIGVLALMHHLPRGLMIFKAACAGFEIEPIIAEDLLATKSGHEIDKIAKYYGVPRGGAQHDVKQIRQLLSEGKSLLEMMEQPLSAQKIKAARCIASCGLLFFFTFLISEATKRHPAEPIRTDSHNHEPSSRYSKRPTSRKSPLELIRLRCIYARAPRNRDD